MHTALANLFSLHHATEQGCIFRLTCSHPELTEDHVLTSAYVKFLEPSQEMRLKEKRLFLTSLKQTCNQYLIKFSENQSAPKLENRKTSPCSPCAPNLLHVLPSRMVGWNKLCNPIKDAPQKLWEESRVGWCLRVFCNILYSLYCQCVSDVV